MIYSESLDDFNIYQVYAHQTAEYPQDKALEYLTIGLCGEVGEFANKVKKTMRDGHELEKHTAKLELGDICWYLAEVCTVLGFDFSSVAERNLEKLADRQSRGVIKGSGDER